MIDYVINLFNAHPVLAILLTIGAFILLVVLIRISIFILTVFMLPILIVGMVIGVPALLILFFGFWVLVAALIIGIPAAIYLGIKKLISKSADIAIIDDPIKPNEETIAAMNDARNGNLITVGGVDDLLDDLNDEESK